MNSSISFSLEAPAFVPKSFPPLNNKTVGTPLTEYFVGSLGILGHGCPMQANRDLGYKIISTTGENLFDNAITC